MAVGVNSFLDSAVVIIASTANVVIFIILIEIESRWASDALSEMPQTKVEIFSDIVAVMLVAGFLIVKAGLVYGCSPSYPAETALRDTPGPAQHLYSPTQGLC